MPPKSDIPKPLFDPSTLVELLSWRSHSYSDKVLYTFLVDKDVEQTITYAELDRQARAVGARLQSMGARAERVLLLYPPGLEFITAFFGCLYAGAIAVPTYPPRPHRSQIPLQAIALDAQATVALTTMALVSKISLALSETPDLKSLRWICTDDTSEDIDHELAAEWQQPTLSATDIAFLQYTSGSTAIPKGVMVSHGNILHNAAVVQRCFGTNTHSRGVFWLPFYHDMGLIGGLLQPLYCKGDCILMSPMTFLQNPFMWLQAISRWKGTISGGPNFAYDLCVDKITPGERESLDLSSWEVAFNGAEPIRQKTLQRFATTFASSGFRWETFYPCYGVAEATLIVSGGARQEPPVAYTVGESALEQNQACEVIGEREGTRTLISSGHPAAELNTLIVDPKSFVPCRPDRVGEIWISGPSIAQGYWQQPEATERTFHAYVAETGEGPFLRTGDLGFLKDGELFVTGRIKDLIIIRGRNYYPDDIELTVEQSNEVIRPNCCAAFAIEAHGEERLAIVAEVGRNYRKLNLAEVIETIRRRVGEHHELHVHAAVLIKTGGMPKTTSGKLQRYACREKFLTGTLDVVAAWTSGLAETKTDGKRSPVVVSESIPNLKGGIDIAFPPSALIVSNTEGNTEGNASRKRADDLINWLRGYAEERINSQIIDERRSIPPYVVLDFGNRGLLGMEVPEKYGGIALCTRDAMRVIEQLAAIDLTLASFVGVNNVLGIRPILHYANASTRDELLPLLARGRELAAFALTEPGAGSNPRAITSVGVPIADGGWRLRGHKVWIGTGSWAGVINVFVKLAEPQDQNDNITGFIVRQGAPGLRHGPEALTMGVRGMVQNEIFLNDVVVSDADLLGKPGEGFVVAQDAMMFGRLGLAAMSVGGMKRCAQLMLRYATRRSVATGRLLDNPVTLVRLSNLTAAITATETLVSRIAELTDAGQSVPAEAFVACKTSGPEFLWTAADMLVQLLGARGYVENNIAPQLMRDARLLRIFEGPTETLHMFLGSSVIHGSPELHQFLCDTLHASNVAIALREAVLEIDARTKQARPAFADVASARRWASSLAGEITTYALLWAVVQEAAAKSKSGDFRRSIDWTRLCFEETLRRAMSGTPAEAVLLSSVAATSLISSYGETIGDLEQRLAGEEQGVDPYLRRDVTPSLVSDQSDYLVASDTSSRQISLREEPRTEAATAPVMASLLAAQASERRGIIETYLREGLARALVVPPARVDVHRPLYSLGMDSLIAVEFKNRIEENFGLVLPVTTFFEEVDIAGLAAQIHQRIQEKIQEKITTHASTHSPELTPSSESFTEHPLSHGQKALWFLHKLAPESTAYNVGAAFEIKGPVDQAVLRSSLQALVDRHSSLRTTFVSRNGEPLQRVHQRMDVCFKVVAFPTESESSMEQRLNEEIETPFDLSEGPLFRATLFARSVDQQVLLFVFHHIVEDFWSLNLTLYELSRLYSAGKAVLAADLLPLPLQYTDYVRRQIDILAGPTGAELWKYWQRQLAGELPLLSLPTDRPHPPVQTYRGDNFTFTLSSALSQRLKLLSEARGVTLYMTLLAAFQVLLNRYSGQDDILVGSPMIGRNRAELAALVGYFVNPVVIRADLSGDPVFNDFLDQIRGTALAAFEHQDFPFPLLVERLQPQRDPGRSPLFQVAFTLQKDLRENLSLINRSRGTPGALELDGIPLEPLPLEHHFAQFDLSLMVTEHKAELEASLEYNVDLFDAVTIDRMAGHFQILLESVVADPGLPISQLQLLTPTEQEELSRFEAGSQSPSLASECERAATSKEMSFSLFYFSCNDAEFADDKYQLLLEGARFADQNGFEAVWTPERHFNAFGGIYPNPSVVGAALAMITKRVRIRAGSVVLPLHDPIRVAEEWAVVDNLSSGRVDLSFATGWNAGDFVLSPANHTNRKEVMFSGIETVRRLWRGETISVPSVTGEDAAVKIYPLPMQRELPVWITCAGNTETFVAAGALGANVLTSLLLQSVDELSERIELYRKARAQHDHGRASGKVTVMLHTFVGKDMSEVRQQVYQPFKDYLRSSVELWRHESRTLDELSERERADLLEYSFERYFRTSALFGTPEKCLEMVDRLTAIGVDEIACLIDFGVSKEQVISNLPLLNLLRESAQAPKVQSSLPVAEIDSSLTAFTSEKGREPVSSNGHSKIKSFSAASIHELIEEQTTHTPDAVAVSFAGQEITYHELNRRANQLAHFLRRSGVGPEVLVGLLVERSIEMMIGLLGILKAGGAYVPLDPAYPDKRLSFMVEDAELSIVLTQGRFVQSLDALTEKGVRTVRLDDDWHLIAAESEANPRSGITADNLAYLIYTSGSTGRPKGVQIPHRAVLNFLDSMRVQIGMTKRDRLLAVTTLSFDIAALELFLPLTVGASIVLVSREVASDGSLLKEQLEISNPSVMQATPATWRLLLTAGWTGSNDLRILCGGEKLSRELANQLLNRTSCCWNLYGPTETTIWSLISRVEAGQEGPVPIGRPISNTQVYILDAQLRRVPVGVPGELYIGGVGLARGYLNRAELTAENFIPHPFDATPGARLYRTGDVVRYLPNGDIEFQGRVDQQVKLRGYRVELGEVEAALVGHPAIREAVAVAREDAAGEKQLVAYLVAQNGAPPAPDELRRYLQEKVPEWMVPSSFVTIAALPLTPNGKVNRRALPKPEQHRPDLAVAYVEPRTSVERTIAGIWQEVLQVERVGLHDNFFDLGGHSLLLAQAHSKMRDIFKQDVALIDLYRYPTISLLTSHVTGDQQVMFLQQTQERAQSRRESLKRQRDLRKGRRNVDAVRGAG